jgi:phosphate:Na+ symporter
MSCIFTLAGGICLLLGGLATMRYGLSRVFAGSMKHILAKLTTTPGHGLVVGTIGAAVMQSSTALTLITVGLVSAEYLSFFQGLSIILGANIGTCTTVQLLNFSWPQELILTSVIACGLLAVIAKKFRQIALAIAGMLCMLAGVNFLSNALGTLSSTDIVISWLAAGHNPLYGIGGGILLTFLVQSSSAATGLLMVLAEEGIIDLTTAVYGVYGNNIGSCLSSLLVGVTAPLAARRVAVSHIILNVIGVMAFLPISGLLAKAATLITDDFSGQVAMVHTLFNIISSLIILPIIKPFGKLICFLVPGRIHRP